MQMAKKQHYLPQFYLKNFTNNDGIIWCFDRLKKNVFACNPRDIACENYLYETRWKDANPKLGEFVYSNQIEKHFSEQEKEYSKLLRRIIDICTNEQKKRAFICNDDEKKVLASFVSNMLLRNPWSMRQADLDCVTDGIMDVEEIRMINNLLQLMDFGGTESLVKFASKMVWLDENFDGSVQQKARDNLLKLKYCIIVAVKGQFVTSSYPVLCGVDEMTEERETIIYFPLHPHIAVLYGKSLPHKVWNRMVSTSEGDIDFLNKQYFKAGDEQIRFIYAQSKTILELLAKCTFT